MQHGDLILVEVKGYIFITVSSHWSQYQSYTHALGHHWDSHLSCHHSWCCSLQSHYHDWTCWNKVWVMRAGWVSLTTVELVVVGVLKVFWDTEDNATELLCKQGGFCHFDLKKLDQYFPQGNASYQVTFCGKTWPHQNRNRCNVIVLKLAEEGTYFVDMVPPDMMFANRAAER